MKQTLLQPLQRTPLHSLHKELNARMVPFAGYSMPLQYEGIKAEHLHARAAASLFDISHMGQIGAHGEGIALALEGLLPVDLLGLGVNRQRYGLLTNEKGGIRDDLLIARWQQDSFFLVVNAARKAQDLAYFKERLGGFQVECLRGRALLALQGPTAAAALGQLCPEGEALSFMSGCHAVIEGAECYVARCGYSGEDGFEISLAAGDAERVARRLLSFKEVQPAGLGARDTLRLEAGLCLYGSELTEDTTPLSAGLGWTIGKARKEGGARCGGFPGADRILAEFKGGAKRHRVGLLVAGPPARAATVLADQKGAEIGMVTSGGYGPSIDRLIAMAYVNAEYAAAGTELLAMIRGKSYPVQVVDLPFVPHRYRR